MKRKLADGTRAVEDSIGRLGTALRGWFFWPALIAVAAGVAVWMLTHRTRLAVLLKNQLPKDERVALWWYVAIAGAILVVSYFAAVFTVRLATGYWHAGRTIGALNRAFCFCLAGPFIAILFTPKIETQSRAFTLFAIACASLLCAPTLLLLFKGSSDQDDDARWGRFRGLSKISRWVIPLAVLAGAVWYSYFFSRLSINNHHGFNSRIIDLGLYDNIFYQSIHGDPLRCTLIKGEYHGTAHFDPILVLLSPLYLIYPRAETPLVLQSVWLAAGAVPLYLIAKRKLNSRVGGLILAFVFLLHPAVHGANMYEFHSLTLLGTPLLWTLYFLERRKVVSFYIMFAVTLLVREDAALVMCFVGAFAILSRQSRLVNVGFTTIVVSLVYFAVVKRFFMPSAEIFNTGKESLSFAYYYREMIPSGEGFSGFVTSLVTNPAFAFKLATKEPKLIYVATMMLPVLFLPLVAKKGRFLLLYGLIFTLLATRAAVFCVHFQYVLLLLPIIFFLTPLGFVGLEQRGVARRFGWRPRQLRNALLGCMLVAAVLTSWKFGGAFQNDSFRGGFVRVTRELNETQQKRYLKFRELVAMIPEHASVSVTNRTGAHVSNRKEVYFYHRRKPTDFVLIDDRQVKGGLRKWHDSRIKNKELVQRGSHESFKLYERVRPPPKKPAAKEDPKKAKPKANKSFKRTPASVKNQPATPATSGAKRPRLAPMRPQPLPSAP